MKKHMPPPFPQALHGKKEINNSSEILEVLRQVKVNIPDATHGSLDLKAYQQNLYLKYYY